MTSRTDQFHRRTSRGSGQVHNPLQPHKHYQAAPGCDINGNTPGWVYAITDLVAHSRGADWLQTKSDIVPEAKEQ